MDTLLLPEAGRPRRRYTPQFKAQIVAACRQPGVSVTAIALENRINPNLLRRWVREYADLPAEPSAPTVLPAPRQALPPPQASFVPVQVAPPIATAEPIRIELRRGEVVLNLAWPATQAEACVYWLRELLR
ncbi:MAG: transposase [Paludibacterium sp.]|uniref:IS66-like element accessory protein TnpA n=1 Tax=Paludibacterium sp. TaxID=1917523 RepID=UPI0025E5A5BE|nr:transposase [Paludibacterium sp.]MBV8047885.1 transposase [Paludibacterium sp.]MBV8649804.1 transposase [Paludibacterium sp.]